MKEYFIPFLFVLLTVDTVLCQTQIRFAGPNSNATQGRLEIFYNGTWGTVCDDGFDTAEAIVICKMLNIPNVNKGTAVNTNVFGPGTGPILLDDLICDATEADISQCRSRGWYVSDCQHSEDVGVICDTSGLVATQPPSATTRSPPVVQPSNCSVDNPYVRLVGPSNMKGVGFVEVNVNNQWGSICDDLWGINEAKVVCGMLCYNKDIARAGAPVEVDYVRQNVSIDTKLDDVSCNGNETNILNCRYKTGSAMSQNCIANRDEFASVSCVELVNAPPEDPVPDLTCTGTHMTATFSKIRDPSLEEKHLTLSNGQSCPTLIKSKDQNYVSISIPFGACGTLERTNETHIMYTNTIRYDYTKQDGNRVKVNLYYVEVSCYFERDLKDNLDKEMQPMSQYVTQKAPGQFNVNMMFFRNNSFLHAESTYPIELTLGEWLYVGLYLESIGSNLKLIVPNCRATPSNNRNDSTSFPLFLDKCALEDTLAFFPLNTTAFGYRYRTFKFMGYDTVVVHCEAFICTLNETSASCDRSCNTTTTATTTTATTPASPAGRRRRRDVDYHHDTIYVSSPPMVVKRTNNGGTIIERWDDTTKSGSSSKVTVPMTVSTQKPSTSTTAAPKTTTTTRKPTTAAPTTKKPTTAAPTTTKPTTAAPTTKQPTAAPTTQKPTAAPTTQKPTTAAPTTQKPTTAAPKTTTPTTTMEPKTTKLKFTTSHKVVKVTESHDNNIQSGNDKRKAEQQSSVVPSSKKSESVKKEETVDIKNDFFIAALAGNPLSKCPPVFSLSQTLFSIFIMVLSVVLLS